VRQSKGFLIFTKLKKLPLSPNPYFTQAMKFIKRCTLAAIGLLLFAHATQGQGRTRSASFRVIAFYTGRNDQAHISFLKDSYKWFPSIAAKYHFSFDTTSNWNNLDSAFLSRYQVVVFLDTRPEAWAQRDAFKRYMERGGAWMGFHFAGFALTPSDFPQDWDWYHIQFLGAGSYVSNTWRPVSAVLRVEPPAHPVTRNLPSTFRSSPSEWYRWEFDLRKNADIQILASIDSSSFPLGTGPKPHEIWRTGYYPVVWTNKNFRMVYFNMGHNDIDYEHKTNKTLSHSFDHPVQDKMIINALLWLGSGKNMK
jgi:hypothetical protein